MLRNDLLPVMVCVVLGLTPEAQGPATGASADLCAADWSGLRAAHEESRHAAFAVEGGYEARNPGQRWRTRFDGRGFTIEPDGAGWRWGLELERYGFAGSERTVRAPGAVGAAGERVAYAWDGILEEWFVNDTRGLEHGFTLRERPALQEASEPRLLTFHLSVRGELRPEVAAGGRDVRFLAGDGTAALTYTGLCVLDADGEHLPARFEQEGEGLRLCVDERGARYPLTVDPVAQQAYLKASNTGTFDQFGYSLSVSGDTVVVGARGEDSNATGVDGDESNNGAGGAGAAYVFVRSGTGWSQEAYLKASNAHSGDYFGSSVSVSGDTLVIGAPFEDSSATGVDGDQDDNGAPDSGAAYVFVRNGTTWSQQAYLKASNTGAGDSFGSSVSVSGDTVVIGAQLEDSNAGGVNGNQSSNNRMEAGAAYVFVRNGTSWSQQAYLKASNPDSEDEFGVSVSVSGDTAVIGAWFEDSSATGVNGSQGNNSNFFTSGAAYVFVRNGTSWSQQAYLKASNTGESEVFGACVSVSGDTVAVGAQHEDSDATGVNGNQTNHLTFSSGAAYVFVRSGTSWSQQAYLKATNTQINDLFGFSVSVSSDTVVVGAIGEDSNATASGGNQASNSAPDAGAAYVFVRSGTSWSPRAYLKASNTQAGDLLGYSVSVAGDTVVVGALSEDSDASGVDGNQASNAAADSGAVYAFRVAPDATVLIRNAGSNPASYAAGPIVVGGAFSATVDNNLAAELTSRLVAFDAPTAVTLAGGQTLLCLDLGSGELFAGSSLAPTASAGGIDSYSLAVPNDPTLAGFAFCSQAIQLGNPPFVLSNAQDFTIGGF